jgi:hypothetical protein
MRKAKIFAAMLMAMSSLGAFAQHQFMVQANKPGVEIQPTMYGIFFEDINFGADGGLYAEMVENRSFEFPQRLMGWNTFGNVTLNDVKPAFDRNPHYVTLESAGAREKQTGLENRGFFGMLMQMPYTMEKSNYYGRGPIENYSDRKDCMRIGVYTDDADNQYFPYIRPQESGTKSDIRWWKQTDATGLGLQVKSCTPFYASAIHFDTEELDDGDDKEQRHSFDLKKSKFTNLFLDSAHMGVGGENSWGAWPLEKYRVHYGNKTFTFTLIPQGK